MAPFQAGGWCVLPCLQAESGPLPGSQWVGAPEAGEEGVHPCCHLRACLCRWAPAAPGVAGKWSNCLHPKGSLGWIAPQGRARLPDHVSHGCLSQWWDGERGTQFQQFPWGKFLCSNFLVGLSILVLSLKRPSPCRVQREPGSITGSLLCSCEHPLSTQTHPNTSMGSSSLAAKEIFFSEYLGFVIVSREKVWFWGTKCNFPASFLWLLEVSACQSN